MKHINNNKYDYTIKTTRIEEADMIMDILESNGFEFTNNWRWIYTFESRTKWVFHVDCFYKKRFNLEG